MCDFDRTITLKYEDMRSFGWLDNVENEVLNDGQVIGIYDKDIFLGVRKKDLDDEEIMKVDLKNETDVSCLQVDEA